MNQELFAGRVGELWDFVSGYYTAKRDLEKFHNAVQSGSHDLDVTVAASSLERLAQTSGSMFAADDNNPAPAFQDLYGKLIELFQDPEDKENLISPDQALSTEEQKQAFYNIIAEGYAAAVSGESKLYDGLREGKTRSEVVRSLFFHSRNSERKILDDIFDHIYRLGAAEGYIVASARFLRVKNEQFAKEAAEKARDHSLASRSDYDIADMVRRYGEVQNLRVVLTVYEDVIFGKQAPERLKGIHNHINRLEPMERWYQSVGDSLLKLGLNLKAADMFRRSQDPRYIR